MKLTAVYSQLYIAVSLALV